MINSLSVIVPVYNSESTIKPLVDEVFACLDSRIKEIILVNDGSSDRSEEICHQMADQDSRIVFLSLRRNFGEHNAVMCGLNYVTGDYAVIIDDDFQNPPEEIIKLVQEAEKGFDVVYSAYEQKKHSAVRNWMSATNDRIASFLLDKPKDLYLSSFKLISAPVIKEIIKYKGPFPYVDGLLLRVTNRISSVQVVHQKRQEGKSTYTLRKLLNLHLNMFFNFSIAPLRLATTMGVCLFALGFVLSILFIIEKFTHPNIPLGWTSLVVSLFMLCGLQMVFLGLIGEYLGKQYLDQNGTPQWVVKPEACRGIEHRNDDA